MINLIKYFFKSLKDYSNEDAFNFKIQMGILISFIPIFFILFHIKVYYGKFFNTEQLPKIQNILRKIFPIISTKVSWIIQESPCIIITIYYQTLYSSKIYNKIIIYFFLFHYVHRTLIYPNFIYSKKNNPLEITLLAFVFCIFNAIMINRSIFIFSIYTKKDLTKFNFIFGTLIFILGFGINIIHDYWMIFQRKINIEETNEHNKRLCIKGKDLDDTIYILPKGLLYEYISCPNYFGEIIEWFGFFLLSYTFSSLVFFIATFCNLFPRAIKYHEWYKVKFKDEYSKDKDLRERKAIIPYLI